MTNAPTATAEPDSVSVAGGRLKSFIERVEHMHEEAAGVSLDLKEIYAEIKGEGFDGKIIKTIVKLRAMDPASRSESEALLDLYISSIGGL